MKSNPMAPIEIGRVQLRKCVVSIQAMKIDNRQMTQSIFRQLPVIRWHDAVKLTPWGWVNYWDNSGHKYYERPAVFEGNGVLHRALIPEAPEERKRTERSLAKAAIVDACEVARKEYSNTSIRYPGYGDVMLISSSGLSSSVAEQTIRDKINTLANELLKADMAALQPELDALDRTDRLLDELGQLFIAT
jgi:hypothetical protein